MKTQSFLSMSLTFALAIFVLGGFKAEKRADHVDLKSITIYHDNFEVEPEEEIRLESWMTDDSCWKVNLQNVNVEGEDAEEEHLAIESWMTDDNLWRF